MQNKHSFTEDGLANLRLYEIDPREVWAALHVQPRVTRDLGDGFRVVYARSPAGRYLVIVLIESRYEDDDWDIVGARDMSSHEVKNFSEATQRGSS